MKASVWLLWLLMFTVGSMVGHMIAARVFPAFVEALVYDCGDVQKGADGRHFLVCKPESPR